MIFESVDTSTAFDEDSWGYLKIGEAIFRTIKLCTRCNFTTVDPDLGEKHKLGEPLKTLKSYR